MQVVSYLAALADFYEVDWMVACPRVEHSPIYQRLFGFVQLAEPRQYFGVKFVTSLLGISREGLKRHTAGTPAKAKETSQPCTPELPTPAAIRSGSIELSRQSPLNRR
jgi:hypothetical protein